MLPSLDLIEQSYKEQIRYLHELDTAHLFQKTWHLNSFVKKQTLTLVSKVINIIYNGNLELVLSSLKPKPRPEGSN